MVLQMNLQSFLLVEQGAGLLSTNDEGTTTGTDRQEHEDPAAQGGTWHPCQAPQTSQTAVVIYNTQTSLTNAQLMYAWYTSEIQGWWMR